MNITIESIKENEDGSADCSVFLDEEAKDFLIRYGLVACITDAVEAGKLLTPTEGEE